jgi:hypothetical protein
MVYPSLPIGVLTLGVDVHSRVLTRLGGACVFFSLVIFVLSLIDHGFVNATH